MADEKDGYRVPILDRENHNSWFRQQRIKLRGKQVFHTCEKKVEEYARVATIGGITKELEELDITDTNTKHMSTIRINIEKKKKYNEDEATVSPSCSNPLTIGKSSNTSHTTSRPTECA
jgi:hypothetical protein